MKTLRLLRVAEELNHYKMDANRHVGGWHFDTQDNYIE